MAEHVQSDSDFSFDATTGSSAGPVLGVVWILLGLGAIALPHIATVASAFALGILLLIGAGSFVAASVQSADTGGTIGGALLALMSGLAGGLLLFQPLEGAVALTLVVGAWLAVAGLVRLGLSTTAPVGAGWIALSGVASLLLGGLLIFSWPTSGLWAIGLFLGIDFLFAGFNALFHD